MEVVYLGIVLFLFLLAIFDLCVGVSNDAVNFLNSAIGAKAASFRVILIVAAVGILCGALFSNGMMEIARHGIFKPEAFYFNELMVVFLAVMVTDVILLDVFNTLGLPTSTTVSMIFELLGGTFALSLIKVANSSYSFDQLINSDKALSVIFAIFLSVLVAFFFGAVVQYLTRLLFSFNYKRNLKWKIGLFAGAATTAIVYFMLIKGIKGAAFMTPEVKDWVHTNTGLILSIAFVVFSALMQFLYICKVNVLKVIVLLGTFGLAMAFAGNDLVNFIGVPLAGFSSFTDFFQYGGENMATYTMSALNEPARTPFYFLLIAGGIMVLSLAYSKKAKHVIKTSVGLSRQEEGDEMFGSSSIARSIVRHSRQLSESISAYIPQRVSRWVDTRFNTQENIVEQGAAFDLVRATVNLVLASLLIALGTSLKLPLSTTYVAFMVAMGSSLSDRAWGRESAVFRITGVISVIGGWFITAAAAFLLCFLVAVVMYYGGIAAMLAMIVLVILLLIRSHIRYGKKSKESEADKVFRLMLSTTDKEEIWEHLLAHCRLTQLAVLQHINSSYSLLTDGLLEENLKKIRSALSGINKMRDKYSKERRKEIVGMRRITLNRSIEKNTWFHLGVNSAIQMNYSLRRISETCKEHVANNFNALPADCRAEFLPIQSKTVALFEEAIMIVSTHDYSDVGTLLLAADEFKKELSKLRKQQMKRLQTEQENLKIGLVYLNLLQENQQLISDLRHLLRAAKRFQH
ncbi:MAG: inorganic phosphate transporter [Bacteroidaceae bacterium]